MTKVIWIKHWEITITKEDYNSLIESENNLNKRLDEYLKTELKDSMKDLEEVMKSNKKEKEKLEILINNMSNNEWYLDISTSYNNKYPSINTFINFERLYNSSEIFKKEVDKIITQKVDDKTMELRKEKWDFLLDKQIFKQEKKSYRLYQWFKSLCFWLGFWLSIYLISLI